MKAYEYIQLEVHPGDLDDLCSLASHGWHVVHSWDRHPDGLMLLEREIPEDKIEYVQKYYAERKK